VLYVGQGQFSHPAGQPLTVVLTCSSSLSLLLLSLLPVRTQLLSASLSTGLCSHSSMGCACLQSHRYVLICIPRVYHADVASKPLWSGKYSPSYLRHPDNISNSVIVCNVNHTRKSVPEVVNVPAGAKIGVFWWGYIVGELRVLYRSTGRN
jgi:hypothetical protein